MNDRHHAAWMARPIIRFPGLFRLPFCKRHLNIAFIQKTVIASHSLVTG
ncbi:hypothetical protein YPPY34_3675 [Yersinia pestis PY-34]|nr:hypothetical protein YPPY03_3732 [Yersinia pestis PY-03]EIR57401.1 hypothetical protein YPPY19_3656 [Yersinia pestis PY-19]EIR73108.1 hypothetical protein YPPY34_3675 [Yersinia pestis PY-34]EIR87515.1 hypothetical protein YPPY42_3705 [Yersinia pestis PY-42]EIS19814.1 hypothetical protein YPPY54_3778 [Yersinia pestis PY-54]